MKLKVLIVEDKKRHVELLKENIQNIFEKYKDEEGLLSNIDNLEVVFIEGTGEENEEYQYYVQDDLVSVLNEKIDELNMDNTKIGICLDLKLTPDDEPHNFGEQPRRIDIAKKIIDSMRQREVELCPVTSIPNFDELSLQIIGENIEDRYLNKESVVYGCIDSEVVRLIYYLANGEMPNQDQLDKMFDYD